MFALLAIATGAQAKLYDLWIAGIQVTDDNKNNITGPGISAEHFPDGKVWYNSDDNILTLENVHIVNSNPTGWVEGIFSMIENLTIVVKGSHNLVESRYNHAILSYSSLTFGDGEQDGILKVVGKLHGIAVWNEKNYLTINNGVRLEVESTESSALYANYAKSGIYIESGTTMLMATSKESNAISGFGFVSYYGSIELCKPQGKSYDKTNRVLGDPKETVVYGRRINITNTKFPDDKLYEEIQKFNTDGNGYLDRDEIYEAQTLSRMNIANYTGISYLWDLRKILVNYTLDDSNYYNLDVKSNPFLEMIYSAQGGHLFSIDNLWACPWLEEVGLYKNHLNLIDVSQNTRLKILKVEDNSIWHVYPPTRLEECLPFASYYIYDNEISSNFMDELIASLPVNNTNKEYRIYVKSEYGDKEQNVCTDQQMNAILEKGWIPAVRTNVNEYKDHSYTYDLTIGGNIKVTDANAHDIMGDGGGMSYDPTTKTLSLMNDYEFSTNGIESHINGLTIKVADNSTLDCQSDAIDLYANTTITGNHQLAVKSKIGVGIFVDDGKTLTIDNATLEMSAQMPCILGATTTGSQKLNIKDSNIEAHSSSSSVAISGFPAGITFEGCNITEPAGGYVKDGNIVDKDGNWAYDVKIQKPSEFYPVYVCGQQLNNLNAADFLGDGTVSYNPDTKTLTLNNATINTDDESGIEFRDFGLNLELIGENHVHSVDGYPVYVGYDMRMVGDGSLEAVSDNNNAIYLFWGGLAVKENVKLTARGGKYGISGYATPYGNVGELHVLSSGAVVKASGPEGSIVALATLKLAEGVAITSPAGALFNETTGNVELRGSTVNGEVVISTNGFVFTLYDGVALTETYSNSQYNAINVLLAGGELVEKYDEASQTTTYSKPSGKKLFVQEPYNNKGDKAFFLANQVEAADAISYDYSDDMESISSGIWSYSYQDGYDMDGALDFIDLYGSIVLNFGIPEERPTENMVIKVKDGMNGITDFNLQQYAALMAMWKFFGAIQFVPEGENYVYKTNDGKVLCYMSQYTGIVTLAEGVTAADKVYHRILHKDREAIKGKVSTNMTGQSFNFGEILQDVRSITLTVDDGAATGITQHTTPSTQHPVYNLSGQRVGNSYRGIAVSNGRKVVIK